MVTHSGDDLTAEVRSARSTKTVKDYTFLTKCHPLTYTICYCFWRTNCTEPEQRAKGGGNETWYIAGWRSWWNKDAQHRE